MEPSVHLSTVLAAGIASSMARPRHSTNHTKMLRSMASDTRLCHHDNSLQNR